MRLPSEVDTPKIVKSNHCSDNILPNIIQSRVSELESAIFKVTTSNFPLVFSWIFSSGILDRNLFINSIDLTYFNTLFYY